MEKKFKLTDETIEFRGHTLYRIKALRSFSDVRKGDKGGFVEREDNLSHDRDCWIYNDSKVLEFARVFGNAKIFGNVEVYDNVEIYDNAKIYGNVKLYKSLLIYDTVEIFGLDKIEIVGDFSIKDNAKITNF